MFIKFLSIHSIKMWSNGKQLLNLDMLYICIVKRFIRISMILFRSLLSWLYRPLVFDKAALEGLSNFAYYFDVECPGSLVDSVLDY